MSLKDLPSPSAPNFQLRVREMLHTMLGKTGSADERLLTLREAVASGVVKPGPGGSLVPGDAIGGGTDGEAYVPDLTPPPSPDTLTATPAISHILLEVPAATYTQGHGHLRTRVYGVTRLSGDPAPVFADAVEVGQFSGTVWAFPSNPSTTWHFWAKWESVDGVLSATPVGGTNGVVATTGQDVSSLLDALAGQISASELAADLATPIGQIPDLFAKYTVKVDVAGHVSGYGLASTANNGAVVSQFGIRADQFFVAPPATSSAIAPTTNIYKGMVWVDTSVTPSVTRYYTGSGWSTTPQVLPFIIQAAPTTINGVSVPAGVYIDTAFIRDGTITNAKIANLAVDDAKIANLSVSKLTAGSIAVGQYIQSTGVHIDGTPSWRIDGNGNATFNNAIVRGTIYATAGEISGSLIAGTISANKISGGTLSGASIAIASSAGGWLLNAGFNTTVVGYRELNGYNIFAGNLASPASPAITGQTGYAGGGVLGTAVASNSNSTAHGVRGSNQNKNTSGLVGAANSYDFYADGAGINYGPFTGAHDALLPLDETPDVGDIMVDTGLCIKGGVSQVITEVRRSTAPQTPAAVGVFAANNGPLAEAYTPAALFFSPDAYYRVKDSYNYGIINSLGEGLVNVCGEGGDISVGDLIVTSSMPGKGMRQDDDLIRSRTVAKARENVTFGSPSEVKQVACIYLCG